MTVFLSKSYFASKVVLVASLTMNYPSKKSKVSHMAYKHFIPAVYTVFKEHYRNLCFLVGFNYFPTFSKRISSTNLTAHSLAFVHCLYTYINMFIPGSTKDNSIYIFHFKDFFIICCCLWAWKSSLLNNISTFYASVFILVTNGCKLS